MTLMGSLTLCLVTFLHCVQPESEWLIAVHRLVQGYKIMISVDDLVAATARNFSKDNSARSRAPSNVGDLIRYLKGRMVKISACNERRL